MNIILCGMMGAGKSTVGAQLAAMTNRRLVDTDEVIVCRHGAISDIFKQRGEAYFRALETETVKEFSKEDGLIISVGGGLVLKEENVSLLRNNGRLIYLSATSQTLIDRLKADTQRPLLQGCEEELSNRILRLMEERAPIYERVADCILNVDSKTPKEVAKEIISLL